MLRSTSRKCLIDSPFLLSLGAKVNVISLLMKSFQPVAEHPVGQGMAVAIPQILLGPHTLNFELNYLGKILSLYTLGQVLY